ncbi:ABC transporter permease [Streptomyces atroolivaceus]|uniref:ABC transporter permease n=1 Tax=Streptomyces atroolivaceus TaxID=66869 RepID=UPI0020241478|nr:ABC transporter permease [Streptomyces atroolivaceus]
MSTLTTLRGPARVVVRQHRWTLWIAGGLFLAGVITLIATALWSAHVVDAFESGPCSAEGDSGRSCDKIVGEYSDTMFDLRRVFEHTALALTALPVLFSMFVAGPMIARELESGTYRVSWTQSVSPARWLTAKLAVPTALLLAGVSVLTALLAWARSHTGTPYPVQWHDATTFSASGVVPLAHTLFGLCVGTLIGLLVHRTLSALTVSVLVTGAAIGGFRYWRGKLWPPRTVSTENIPEGVWWVERGHLTSTGERMSQELCTRSASEADRLQCLADHDITGHYLDYHPASHFWPIQLVETGILLALAALALALAFRVLRRRTG